ncbi:MAG: inorganic phosphate transporter [Chitinophagales bacterium]|nr:inorganic phosphate transporter [Chitinophagales bacterium]HMV13861.1 PiT family inorganic phosphate transporter [Chitinophagales bacterium]HMW12218.1 PiT family inorganic phosphate transporter [Chitinophagales bacterium]HMX60323.1 PiT family inorganic phosphate transporter [Chitinophagales bacterium]HMY23533.1 PiT family inorganic phosphate transporter [Chitinophagales bacterium]
MEFIIIVIAMALIFDYINGFHDAANSIATIVSTKVLTPFQAVLWAAFFNFVAFLIFKDHAVANTIGKTVQENYITLPVIFSGLLAAIFWNLLTWWYGIPSSSSHTLIGGFAGAAVAHAFMKNGVMPLQDIIDSGKVLKTIAFILFAPLIGMAISMFYTLVMMNNNTWIKVGILSLTAVAIWFTFIHFQEKKIDDNIAKFFRIEKYEHALHDATSAEEKEKLSKKLAQAQQDAQKSYTFISHYESRGSKVVANEIANTVDLDAVTAARIEDKLKVFFEVKKLENKAKKDEYYKNASAKAKAAVDSLKPIAKLHASLGMNNMAEAMYDKGLVQPNKHDEFVKMVQIDIKKDLAKEMDKSNNRIIRYGLIVMLAIIILSFIYNEKIKEPSAQRTANNFKKLQLLSSAAFSVGHGGNDAQKVMGIIAAALIANGNITDIKNMPDWVPLSCYLAIGLGTLSGGWKIVKTMGSKITKVTPLEGVCAETSGATTLFLTEQMGIPVSTTHTITGAIIGVGATKRLSAVRWGVTVNLLWAWILTIPVSALLASITYYIVQFFVK